MNGPKKDVDPATELVEQDEEQSLPEIEHETAIDLAAGNPLAAGRATLARFAKHAPKSPGVYRMIDANGDVLYVGKAEEHQKAHRRLYAADRLRQPYRAHDCGDRRPSNSSRPRPRPRRCCSKPT